MLVKMLTENNLTLEQYLTHYEQYPQIQNSCGGA